MFCKRIILHVLKSLAEALPANRIWSFSKGKRGIRKNLYSMFLVLTGCTLQKNFYNIFIPASQISCKLLFERDTGFKMYLMICINNKNSLFKLAAKGPSFFRRNTPF